MISRCQRLFARTRSRTHSALILILTLTLTVLSLSVPTLVPAQVYPYRHYDTRAGLPNPNVYGMAADSVGFIWIATENGLARFDGQQFKHYTLQQLGVSSYISSIALLSKYEMVFGVGVGGAYKINIITGNVTRLNQMPLARCNSIIVIDTLIIALNEYNTINFLLLGQKGRVVVDTALDNNPKSEPLCITKLRSGQVLIGRYDGLYELNGLHQKKIDFGITTKSFPIFSIYEHENGNWYLGAENSILICRQGRVIAKHDLKLHGETRIRHIITDQQNRIWFNPWGSHEIYQLIDTRLNALHEQVNIMHSNISTIYSHQDNIWVGTLGKGVIQFTNQHIQNFSFSKRLKNANVRKLKFIQGGILIGTGDGLAYYKFSNNQVYFTKQIPEMSQYVRDICVINDKEYVVSITDMKFKNSLKTLHNFIDARISVRYSHSSCNYLYDKLLYVGNWDNLIKIYNLPNFIQLDSMYPIFPTHMMQLRLNTICFDSFMRLWCGSSKGICIKSKTKDFYLPNPKNQFYEVFKLIPLRDGKMLSVSSSGITTYSYDSTLSSIKIDTHHKFPNTTSFARINDSDFLVGTNEGLRIYSKDMKILLTINNGLISNDVNDVLFIPEYRIAIIGTTEGFSILDYDLFQKNMKESPTLFPLSLRVGKLEYIGTENIQRNVVNMKFGQLFVLDIASFNYSNPYELKVRYRIDSGKWQQLNESTLALRSLIPGAHHIQLQSGFQENWSKPQIIIVYVSPPFYRKSWFYATTSLFLIVACYSLYRHISERKKKKQEINHKLKEKLIELRQQALAGSLNPHFVFNALNSIQHVVNRSGPSEANEYLAQFAHLMRMHLNMVDQPFIILEDDLHRLTLYLGLERLRLGEGFSFGMEQGLLPLGGRLYIPNMILQPFVENSVWHGIMPTGKGGRVVVRVDTEGAVVRITVTDNGVGLQHSPHREGHVSRGVALIRERLLLLDPEGGEPLLFEPLSPGTRVTIILTPGRYRLKNDTSSLS